MSTIAEHAWGSSAAADRVWSQVCGLRPARAPGRLMMVLQAYIDDSQDENGVYVLAGYISTAEKWAAFSREWEKMLSVASLSKDGVRHFKMSEMALSPDRMSRVPGFHALIHEYAIASIACALNINDIENAHQRLRLPDFPNIEILRGESHFKICFNILMLSFHKHIRNHPLLAEAIKEPVDFYFDKMSDQSQVISGWDQFMSWVPDDERALYGGMPRFEDDRQFLPIQAADFRAWWVRKWCVEQGLERGVKEKPNYGYQSASKKILNIGIVASEETIFEGFKIGLRRDLGEDLRIDDMKVFPNPDGPSPLSRWLSYLGTKIARIMPSRP